MVEIQVRDNALWLESANTLRGPQIEHVLSQMVFPFEHGLILDTNNSHWKDVPFKLCVRQSISNVFRIKLCLLVYRCAIVGEEIISDDLRWIAWRFTDLRGAHLKVGRQLRDIQYLDIRERSHSHRMASVFHLSSYGYRPERVFWVEGQGLIVDPQRSQIDAYPRTFRQVQLVLHGQPLTAGKKRVDNRDDESAPQRPSISVIFKLLLALVSFASGAQISYEGFAYLDECRRFRGVFYLIVSIPFIIISFWLIFYRCLCFLLTPLRSKPNPNGINVNQSFECFMESQRME